MNEIRPLQESSIRKIVAEQAVTDLSGIVKELVDNALDAQSKSINIRLFGQGLEVIEVSDDGTGVPKLSRPFMATRYATSKIRSLDDIYNTSNDDASLGFRGEALFSMAALSKNLVVATRTIEESVARRLEFGRDGSLAPNENPTLPRKIGTTVAVVKPFYAVPARRADMARRIKAERTKLYRLMQSYAIFQIGVRIHLIDIVPTGSGSRENVAVATSGTSKKLQENISSVLGHAFLTTMAPFDVDLSPIANSTTNHNDSELKVAATESDQSSVSGYISKSPISTKSPSAQVNYYCINGRPVDIPPITTMLRQIWQSFGGRKKPSCVLHFRLANNAYDINIAPDKREVILTNEKEILQLVQEKVIRFWTTNGTFPVSPLEPSSVLNQMQIKVLERGEATDARQHDSERQQHKRRNAFVHDLSKAKMQHELEARTIVDQTVADSKPPAKEEPQITEEDVRITKRRRVSRDREVIGDAPDTVDPQFSQGRRISGETESVGDESAPEDTCDKTASMPSPNKTPEKVSDMDLRRWISVKQKFNDTTGEYNEQASPEKQLPRSPTSVARKRGFSQFAASNASPYLVGKGSNPLERFAFRSGEPPEFSIPSSPTKTCFPSPDADDESVEQKPVIWNAYQGTAQVAKEARLHRIEMQRRKNKLRRSHGSDCDMIDVQQQQTGGDNSIKADEKDDSIVRLSKDDFRHENMQVIGQFNLGFILAKCRNNNLWILDQHACDEKYNFENLVRTTVMHEQKLIRPMPVDLSASEESCILDNMEIFEKNGFRFDFDHTAPIRSRLKLTALPHSGARDGRKAVQFGKDDVSTLCAILSDGSAYEGGDGGTGTDGTGRYGNNAVRRYASQVAGKSDQMLARLPKAIAMFASRACRTSIMIGTALSQKEMEQVVQRLTDVEHPWNCPHGRPTMRHVGDLFPVMRKDEREAQQYYTGPTATVTRPTQSSQEE